jgi:hypothetical protein
MALRASRPKHASFSASSHTVRHASGTSTGAHAPVAFSAEPMRRFHPPLKLTSAHDRMRTQLRTVHGAHTTSARAVAASAAFARARAAAPGGTHKNPRHGASTSDCGRTSVAMPMTSPAPTSPARERSDAAHAPIARRAAVTPSVMRAGVYITSAG